MPDAAAAIKDVERALKELQLAWNSAEGRRGRIGENRKHVAQQQSEVEAQKELLRQEQWKLKKESATLQHARDEAEARGRQIAALTDERNENREQRRAILAKTKAIRGELRP